MCGEEIKCSDWQGMSIVTVAVKKCFHLRQSTETHTVGTFKSIATHLLLFLRKMSASSRSDKFSESEKGRTGLSFSTLLVTRIFYMSVRGAEVGGLGT